MLVYNQIIALTGQIGKMIYQELISMPSLRTLVATGAVTSATVVLSDIGYALVVSAGSKSFSLKAQRGGVRLFRSLDAVAGLASRSGIQELHVPLAKEKHEAIYAIPSHT